MDIQVNKFRETLGLFKLVVPRKKTRLEVLKNVMLKNGKAVGTDMETLVVVPLPEADLDCLIPYAEVVKVLDYVPGDEMLHITIEKGMINMSWSDGSAKFETSKTVDEYPPIPEFAVDGEAMVDADALIRTLEDIIVYASSEESRPVLSGIALALGTEQSQIAAGDGFRMALQMLPLKFSKEATIIVPTSSVDVLKLLWQKTPRTPPVGAESLIPIITAKKWATIALDAEKKGLRVSFGESVIAFVHLIQGTPPDFVKLIPTAEPKMVASVLGAELDLAVRRLQNIARESSDVIRMTFKEDGTAIVAARGNGHNAQSSITVLNMKGDPNRVAMNSKYLLDYLKGKEGIVTISLNESTAPVGFRYQKAPTVLIMPMQVDWGDKPAEAEAEKPAEASETDEAGEAADPEEPAEAEEPAETKAE